MTGTPHDEVVRSQALREFDKATYQQQAANLRRSWFSGVTLAVAIALLVNYSENAWVLLFQTPANFHPKWFWNYEIDASIATAVVIGMTAVAATINVAAVASSWRPGHLDEHVERAVDHWVEVIREASGWAACLSVSASLLILHSSPVTAAVLLLTSIVTTYLNVAIVGRPSNLAEVAGENKLQRELWSTSRELDECTNDLPAQLAVEMPTRAVRRGWVAVLFGPFVLATIAVGITFSAWVTVNGVGEWIFTSEFATLMASWLWILGFVCAVQALAVVGFSSLLVHEKSLRWGALGSLLGAPTVLLLMLSLLPLALFPYQASVPQEAALLACVLVPTVTTFLLLRAGRRGRRPGVVVWSRRFRRLQADLDRAKCNLEKFESRRHLLRNLSAVNGSSDPAPNHKWRRRLGRWLAARGTPRR